MKNPTAAPSGCRGYAAPGYYFITLVTAARAPLFGELVNGFAHLNDLGRLVEQEWLRLPGRFPNVLLDAFALMPTHHHGLIQIMESRSGDLATGRVESFGSPVPGSIWTIVRAFKSSVAFRTHWYIEGLEGADWQRNYLESVIRDGRHLKNVRRYIQNHPSR